MKNSQKRGLTVRIVAILMAAIMVLSLGTVLVQTVFATEGVPVTGSAASEKWPIFVAIGALFLIVICAVLPSFKKKK